MKDNASTTPAAWLTVPELSAEIRTPESTLRYWRHRGVGPRCTKLGRRVLYRRADVDAWLADMEASQNAGRRSA